MRDDADWKKKVPDRAPEVRSIFLEDNSLCPEHLKGLLDGVIRQDEKLYWYGQPNPKSVFGLEDIPIILFSLAWGGFPFYAALNGIAKAGLVAFFSNPASLFIFLFPAIAFYFAVGRYFHAMHIKQRTHYFVTDQRVLSLCTLRGNIVRALMIEQVPGIIKTVNRSGEGSLFFGPFMQNVGDFENPGARIFSRERPEFVGFHGIAEVHKVHRLINELRAKSL